MKPLTELFRPIRLTKRIPATFDLGRYIIDQYPLNSLREILNMLPSTIQFLKPESTILILFDFDFDSDSWYDTWDEDMHA